MNEAEWLAATDPTKVLYHFDREASARRIRLFNCAGVRRATALMADPCCREAVELAERLADQVVDFPDWYQQSRQLSVRYGVSSGRHSFADAAARRTAGRLLAYSSWHASKEGAWWEACKAITRTRVDPAAVGHANWDLALKASKAAFFPLLRDIFGNPVRPVAFSTGWRTPTVTNLAETIYDDRQLPTGLFDNQRLAVLADALEDAGCDNEDLLGHLRGGGDHVRGCWAVDLVLGKDQVDLAN